MNGKLLKRTVVLFLLFASACAGQPESGAAATSLPSPVGPTFTVEGASTATQEPEPSSSGLTSDQATTLESLVKVDPYPLYVLKYAGDYKPLQAQWSALPPRSQPAYGCSLFTTLADPNNLLFGRNFDWHFSPALLVFTDPPGGYASVSMVDLDYLLDDQDPYRLDELSLEDRKPLLFAPFMPFDGMNETGLAIGMAAVPDTDLPFDAGKETIGSIGIIRQVLDRAATVEEAVQIFRSYNIDTSGGPIIHYMVSDATQNAVLVEFYDGEMVVTPNAGPHHEMTNFLRAAQGPPDPGAPNGGVAPNICWRYNTIYSALDPAGGQLAVPEALGLLDDVAQANTQWSVVYEMSARRINVVVGQNYEQVHTFELRTDEQH